jgi:hypothetical protein
VRAVVAAFKPADDDGALGQVQVIPSQVTCFAYAKAVESNQFGNRNLS